MKGKRILAAILAALTIGAAAVSLTACGGSTTGSKKTPSEVYEESMKNLQKEREKQKEKLQKEFSEKLYGSQRTSSSDSGGTMSSYSGGTTSSATPTYPYTSYGSETTGSGSGGTTSSYSGETANPYSGGSMPASLEGTRWEVAKVSANGEEMDAQQFYRQRTGTAGTMYMEFKNGIAVVSGMGEFETGSYIYENGKLTIDGIACRMEGDTIMMETDGVIVTFKRI